MAKSDEKWGKFFTAWHDEGEPDFGRTFAT